MKKYLLLFALLLPSQLFSVKSSRRVHWRKRLIRGKSRKKRITEPLQSILKQTGHSIPPSKPFPSSKPFAPPWKKPPGEIISPPNKPYQFWSKAVLLVPVYPLGSMQPSHFTPLQYLVPTYYVVALKQLTLVQPQNPNPENDPQTGQKS